MVGPTQLSLILNQSFAQSGQKKFSHIFHWKFYRFSDLKMSHDKLIERPEFVMEGEMK